MGQPVVHFEIIAKDAEKTVKYYSELFGWKIDYNNQVRYGTVPREENLSGDGIGIGGGIGAGPEGYPGHVTFYVEVPDVEAALAKAESLGGTRMMGAPRSCRPDSRRTFHRPRRSHGRCRWIGLLRA
jgi:predicted enzyme related to lactoylglutathione lyase